MLYSINVIKSVGELNTCPEFKVNNFNWGGDYRPEVTGRLGYVENEGFVLKMKCMEANPVADYSEYQDPVYKDSAMEAFFDFDPEDGKIHYTNFEINSLGAYLNHFGGPRKSGTRAKVADFTDKLPEVVAEKNADSWEVTVKIPNTFIADLFGKKTFERGDVIRFNCYKIRETNDERCPEHYASMAPIETEKPDFHRPEFFAEGVLC